VEIRDHYGGDPLCKYTQRSYADIGGSFADM